MPRVKHKKVFEWRAICRAIDKAAEPTWQGNLAEIDQQTLRLVRGPHGDTKAVGRLTKRLWVIASTIGVKLVYRCQRGSTTAIKPVAQVYLAADGKTLYAIDAEAYGPAVSKHTPFNACDRPDRGTVFRHGRDGVWSRGVCEYYPNVVPRRVQRPLREFCEEVRRASIDSGDAKWGEQAAGFLIQVTRAVRQFPDVQIRLRRSVGTGGLEFVGSDKGRTRVRSPFGVMVDLQAPGLRDSGHVDLRLTMLGPIEGFEESAPVHYAFCGVRADGSGTAIANCLHSTVLSDMKWAVTRSRRNVVNLAREWAASKVRIPCT